MPLVSVIMNVRNGAATIREAIDSVVQQTFLDWELIVWDDRSTDSSAAIVAQCSDSRICYVLSPDDVPLGTARNDAMRQASGEWLAFLDQDDIWLPHKLEKQMALVSDGVGLIYGRTVRFYPNGSERDYDFTHEYSLLPEGDIFTQLFTKSCFIAMSSAVFRRSAIETIGGIPDAIQIVPDYYLYVAVANRYEVRAVQEVVCRYRMHADSMSHTVALAMHREALRMIESWAEELHPATLALCRRRHQTSIALEEMRRKNTRAIGLMRLVTKGSIGSQLARPFLFAFHLVRRNLRPPYWKKLGTRPSV
jgi:glycosyltransferase involved in cell wall biosynthesis